jgi:hypothetical protein
MTQTGTRDAFLCTSQDRPKEKGSQNCTPAISNGMTRRLLGEKRNSPRTPSSRFDGIKVVQPVGFLPNAANAAVHCLSSSTRWNNSSIALIIRPAAIPPKSTRIELGFMAPWSLPARFISKDHAKRNRFVRKCPRSSCLFGDVLIEPTARVPPIHFLVCRTAFSRYVVNTLQPLGIVVSILVMTDLPAFAPLRRIGLE